MLLLLQREQWTRKIPLYASISHNAPTFWALYVCLTRLSNVMPEQKSPPILYFYKSVTELSTLSQIGYILGQTEDGIPVNSYFVEHPDMMLGTMSNDSGMRMYGNANSTSCVPFPDSDLSEQLADAITNIHAEITDYERGEDEPEEDNSIPADPTVRNFSYTLANGQIYYRQDSRMVPVELPVTTQSRVKGMIALA